MFKLQKTESGIYYVHDYIPVRKFNEYSKEQVELSKQIWKYKNSEKNELMLFTNELMNAINELPIVSNKVGLVAVPPSKVDKHSPVRDSIHMIFKGQENGQIKKVFNYNKEIFDFSTLLMRTSDISTAHEGRRSTYNEQKASISCRLNRLSSYWTTFILLDDITTKGTSMEVCRDILIEHGAKPKYIYRLAIARTV